MRIANEHDPSGHKVAEESPAGPPARHVRLKGFFVFTAAALLAVLMFSAFVKVSDEQGLTPELFFFGAIICGGFAWFGLLQCITGTTRRVAPKDLLNEKALAFVEENISPASDDSSTTDIRLQGLLLFIAAGLLAVLIYSAALKTGYKPDLDSYFFAIPGVISLVGLLQCIFGKRLSDLSRSWESLSRLKQFLLALIGVPILLAIIIPLFVYLLS
jgi:hypothetical protein